MSTNKFSERETFTRSSVLKPITLKSGQVIHRPIVIEQNSAQGFALKADGFPRSEISMLNKASSELELQAAIRKMREVQGKKVSMTYEEAMKQIKPRFVDLPHEREMFAEYVFNTTGKSLDDIYKATSTTEDVEPDVTPAPAAE